MRENWLALYAVIVNQNLSVNKALMTMGITKVKPRGNKNAR